MSRKEHEFTLILATDPTDDEADQLYGLFSDGTISTIAGLPQIHFHRAGDSLEEALSTALADVATIGFRVVRIEMEPAAIAATN